MVLSQNEKKILKKRKIITNTTNTLTNYYTQFTTHPSTIYPVTFAFKLNITSVYIPVYNMLYILFAKSKKVKNTKNYGVLAKRKPTLRPRKPGLT